MVKGILNEGETYERVAGKKKKDDQKLSKNEEKWGGTWVKEKDE